MSQGDLKQNEEIVKKFVSKNQHLFENSRKAFKDKYINEFNAKETEYIEQLESDKWELSQALLAIKVILNQHKRHDKVKLSTLINNRLEQALHDGNVDRKRLEFLNKHALDNKIK